MSYNKTVSDHYLHGDLLTAIKSALAKIGKNSESVSVADLAPVDEFHIGGRQATDHLLSHLPITKDTHLLDVGCGLGGAARYIVEQFNNSITGIDLTEEYVETGKVLTQWLGLDSQVNLLQGSALSMPFEDSCFDGGYMLHVGMNIADKTMLFKEIFRVIKPGSTFAVYDIMRQEQGNLKYPVPWAMNNKTSHLATPEQYHQAMQDSGFQVKTINVRRKFALDFFAQLHIKNSQNGGPPPIGLHLLMQASTAIKIPNMIENINNKLIAPVEIIGIKTK